MTPVERLQAAIDKLEQLRSERGYIEFNGWLAEAVDEHTCGTGKDGYYGLHEPGCGLSPVTNDELIVTLHRTIPAQLAILRFAVEGLYDLPEFMGLADAILDNKEA